MLPEAGMRFNELLQSRFYKIDGSDLKKGGLARIFVKDQLFCRYVRINVYVAFPKRGHLHF